MPSPGRHTPAQKIPRDPPQRASRAARADGEDLGKSGAHVSMCASPRIRPPRAPSQRRSMPKSPSYLHGMFEHLARVRRWHTAARTISTDYTRWKRPWRPTNKQITDTHPGNMTLSQMHINIKPNPPPNTSSADTYRQTSSSTTRSTWESTSPWLRL